MSFIRNLLLSCSMLALGVAIAHPAQAFTLVTPPANDAAFENLKLTGAFTEKFVAETRIGDSDAQGSAANRTHEFNLQKVTQSPTGDLFSILSQAQHQWKNGETLDFSLEYTGSLLNYRVNNQLIGSSAVVGGLTDLFLRTRSANRSDILLSNLSLTDTKGTQTLSNLGSSTDTAGASDIDYLHIRGIQGAFTFTGKSTVNWKDMTPRNSALAYQIKLGTSPVEPPPARVPEPGAIAALGAVGSAALLRRKAKKIQAI
ncbi:MAG: PEP-CTERM sorting domain-containing protein [Oculatellaceae cyanobacterium Prado106]|nr:PEP-CTERM sorting domain-containing protein [Oculatellaceae cyanobacterium Prado106]